MIVGSFTVYCEQSSMGTSLVSSLASSSSGLELHVPNIFHPVWSASDKNSPTLYTEYTGASSIAPELALLTAGESGQLCVCVGEWGVCMRVCVWVGDVCVCVCMGGWCVCVWVGGWCVCVWVDDVCVYMWIGGWCVCLCVGGWCVCMEEGSIDKVNINISLRFF